MSAATSIRLESVTVRYGAVTALDDVTLSIAPGAVTALVGMNGAGKSTLFGAITGRLRAHRGRVEVLGGTPDAARRAGRVAVMPQSDGIDPDFPVSVSDVVAQGRYGRLGLTRRLSPDDREAVADALARVQLTELAERPIAALSGGQRRRTFVARALAQQAEVLLLDEPYAGVDVVSERLIADVLADLAAAGATVLVSTHDLSTLPDRADRVLLLARRLVADGPPDEVLAPEVLARAFGLPRDVAGSDAS
ncbi:MAG: metal ABC transporter ATP-binding protein [Microcella sp.]